MNVPKGLYLSRPTIHDLEGYFWSVWDLKAGFSSPNPGETVYLYDRSTERWYIGRLVDFRVSLYNGETAELRRLLCQTMGKLSLPRHDEDYFASVEGKKGFLWIVRAGHCEEVAPPAETWPWGHRSFHRAV